MKKLLNATHEADWSICMPMGPYLYDEMLTPFQETVAKPIYEKRGRKMRLALVKNLVNPTAGVEGKVEWLENENQNLYKILLTLKATNWVLRQHDDGPCLKEYELFPTVEMSIYPPIYTPTNKIAQKKFKIINNSASVPNAEAKSHFPDVTLHETGISLAANEIAYQLAEKSGLDFVIIEIYGAVVGARLADLTPLDLERTPEVADGVPAPTDNSNPFRVLKPGNHAFSFHLTFPRTDIPPTYYSWGRQRKRAGVAYTVHAKAILVQKNGKIYDPIKIGHPVLVWNPRSDYLPPDIVNSPPSPVTVDKEGVILTATLAKRAFSLGEPVKINVQVRNTTSSKISGIKSVMKEELISHLGDREQAEVFRDVLKVGDTHEHYGTTVEGKGMLDTTIQFMLPKDQDYHPTIELDHLRHIFHINVYAKATKVKLPVVLIPVYVPLLISAPSLAAGKSPAAASGSGKKDDAAIVAPLVIHKEGATENAMTSPRGGGSKIEAPKSPRGDKPGSPREEKKGSKIEPPKSPRNNDSKDKLTSSQGGSKIKKDK